jgi:hypothetical protein
MKRTADSSAFWRSMLSITLMISAFFATFVPSCGYPFPEEELPQKGAKNAKEKKKTNAWAKTSSFWAATNGFATPLAGIHEYGYHST